jgi:Zn-dependent metalloprotease
MVYGDSDGQISNRFTMCLFSRKLKGVALRSMKDPRTGYDDPRIGKDPQPAHMRDYFKRQWWREYNSGIPNRAFCLISIEIGGKVWQKAGKIW